MRCLPRLFTKRVLWVCENLGRERCDGNVMFTYVVTTGDEKDAVKMRGAKEVLGLCLDGHGSQNEDDDIFVTMMLRGAIMAALVLYCVRRFDVV